MLLGTPKSLVGTIPSLCPDCENIPTPPSTQFTSLPVKFPSAVCVAPPPNPSPIFALKSISPWYIPIY